MRGSAISHLAMTTFCWLPPDSAPGRNVGSAGADCEKIDHVADELHLSGVIDHAAA